jgi:hypothetical protein
MPGFIRSSYKTNIIFFTSIFKYKLHFNVPITGFKKINYNNCESIYSNNNQKNLINNTINNHINNKQYKIITNTNNNFNLFEINILNINNSKNIIWIPTYDLQFCNLFIRDIYIQKYYIDSNTKKHIDIFLKYK